MSGTVEQRDSKIAWTPPPVLPHRELEWQAWVAKGRAREQRASAARVKTVKWATIAGLLLTGALWSNLAPYHIAIRFGVAAAALVVLFQAAHARRYVVAIAFGAVALLYNPVMPAFAFAGHWPRILVMASAIPFVASLVWPGNKDKPL